MPAGDSPSPTASLSFGASPSSSPGGIAAAADGGGGGGGIGLAAGAAGGGIVVIVGIVLAVLLVRRRRAKRESIRKGAKGGATLGTVGDNDELVIENSARGLRAGGGGSQRAAFLPAPATASAPVAVAAVAAAGTSGSNVGSSIAAHGGLIAAYGATSASKRGVAASQVRTAASSKGDKVRRADLRTPTVDETAKTAAVASDLPSGWEAVVADDGSTYYHHLSSGTTSWDKPKTAEVIINEAASRLALTPTDALKADVRDAIEQRRKQASSRQLGIAAAATAGADSAKSLPDGWEAVESAEGTYYSHAEHGTTWDRPSRSRSDKAQAAHSPTAAAATSAALPAGWSTAEADGATYYVNDVTQETSWERPTEPAQQAAAPNAAPQLRSGWAAVQADDGSTYYVHEATGQSSWEIPA